MVQGLVDMRFFRPSSDVRGNHRGSDQVGGHRFNGESRFRLLEAKEYAADGMRRTMPRVRPAPAGADERVGPSVALHLCWMTVAHLGCSNRKQANPVKQRIPKPRRGMT